jgi:hypothetical protein
MKISNERQNLDQIFAWIQFYGETLQHLGSVASREEKLRKNKDLIPSDYETLLLLREQRCYAVVALKHIANELQEKYGISIPDINGWKIAGGYRFVKDPDLRKKLK